jgi:hypothetical protein
MMPTQCWKVKKVGDLMIREPATEALVNDQVFDQGTGEVPLPLAGQSGHERGSSGHHPWRLALVGLIFFFLFFFFFDIFCFFYFVKNTSQFFVVHKHFLVYQTNLLLWTSQIILFQMWPPPKHFSMFRLSKTLFKTQNTFQKLYQTDPSSLDKCPLPSSPCSEPLE